MRRAFLLLLLTALASCGGEPARLRFAFRIAGLAPAGCMLPGLQAKLEVAPFPDCPLTVASDDTVTGDCPAVPAGAMREFKLVYFVLLANDPKPELDLATAVADVDLTGWTQKTLELDFPSDSINTDIDDDNDGLSNIQELCMGKNPRGLP
jgi:hypothetical protein